MKNSTTVLYRLPAVLVAGLMACDVDATAPDRPPVAGLEGRILDVRGVPVSGAHLSLLYGYLDSFTDPVIATTASRTSVADSLPFSFQTSFPNPVANSFYTRFTMPVASTVTVSLHRPGHVQPILERTEALTAGWYQQFYSRVVETHGLPNGLYELRLIAQPDSAGEVFASTQNILVVSDKGPSNTTTDEGGAYFIEYDWIADGDSILATTDGVRPTTVKLGRTLNILLTRGNQRFVVRDLDLLPGIRLRRDIVLKDTLR